MTIMFDRDKFFDSIRESLFKGKMSQRQVDGLNYKLDVWEQRPYSEDLRWLAYALATSYHETAHTMWPIEEYGKGKGKAYGKVDPKTGKVYYGRGDVQLTWKDNYIKMTAVLLYAFPTHDIDLVNQPEQALNPEYSACIMYEGMTKGTFTGKELDDYFTDTRDNPRGARAIINSDVSKNGSMIAGYHAKFLTALSSSLIELPPSRPAPQVLIAISQPEGVEVVVTVDGKVLS